MQDEQSGSQGPAARLGSVARTLALPQVAATNTSATLDFPSAHASIAKAKRMEAANLQLTPDAKQQQGQAVTQLATTCTPALLASAAASRPDLAVSKQAVKEVASMPGPMLICEEASGTVADGPQEIEEVGKHQQGITQPHAAVSKPNLAGQDGQQTVQVAADEVMAEATEAADQLPFSYPATLVATLPCTVPAWLAQSQRTTVTNVPPTQLVPTQAAQGLVATARLPVVASKGLTPLTSTGRMLPQGISSAVQERPRCRLVSRLSQHSESVPEHQPNQAHAEKLPLPVHGSQQHHAGTPAHKKEAAAVFGADLQHVALLRLNTTVSKTRSAAPDAVLAAQPSEARAVERSPSGQLAERGKRAAECSPGAYDMEKGTHKRARSDSPTRKPDWQRSSMSAAERKGPSDEDVQVRNACGCHPRCQDG